MYVYVYIYIFIYLFVYLFIYIYRNIRLMMIYIYISCITLRILDYGNCGKFLLWVMQDLYHQPYNIYI